MAAPQGNQYAAKSKQWLMAIERALEKRALERNQQSRMEALDALAEKLLAAADAGEMAALKELGDRLDGKPAQSVTVAGDQENPLLTELRVSFK